MVKLHSCRIFKEILEGRRECQQIIRDPSFSHLREGVIYQPSIQTSNKSTCVKAYVDCILSYLNLTVCNIRFCTLISKVEVSTSIWD